MKRLKSIVLLFLIILSAQAQTEHAKFMGIPINGTINQFQQKLQAKGIKYDSVASKQLDKGTRILQGSFAGNKAEFYVFYEPKTTIVYQIGVVIKCLSLDLAKKEMEGYDYMLSEKYVKHTEWDGNGYYYFIPSKDYSEPIGWVQLWYDDNEYNYDYPYSLFIKYVDTVNYDLYDNTIKNDI